MLLLTLTLALATIAWGQSPPPNGAVNTNTGPLNTSSGYVYNSAPPSPPVMAAPVVHLGPVLQDVGPAQAGSTTAVVSSGAATGATAPSQVVLVTPQAVVSQGNPAGAVDRGVASFESVYDSRAESSLASGGSLAELAAQNRARSGAQSAHVYTNADVDRMNQQTGVTGGMTGAAVGAAGSAAPLTSPATTPSVAQPAGAQPQNPRGMTSPFAPRTQPPAPHEQSRLGATGDTQMAEANPPAVPDVAAANATEAQSSAAADRGSAADSQTAAPPAQSERQGALPRTASPLPLLALAGLAAGAVGLVLRRR